MRAGRCCAPRSVRCHLAHGPRSCRAPRAEAHGQTWSSAPPSVRTVVLSRRAERSAVPVLLMRPAELLGLGKAPIAIGFFESPPPGVPRWEGGAVAAGCMFWEKAMSGQTFYTVPSDHYNCAVGSYTHRIALPAE